ncbi:hypothetical protein DUNSADRAFT_6368, partial [Dunaliella salina]
MQRRNHTVGINMHCCKHHPFVCAHGRIFGGCCSEDSFAPGTLVPTVARKCGHLSRNLVPAPPLRVQCKDAIYAYCLYDLVLGLAVKLSSKAVAASALGLGPAVTARGLASRAGLTLAASTAVGLAQM